LDGPTISEESADVQERLPRPAYTDPKLEPAIVTIGLAASYDGVARR